VWVVQLDKSGAEIKHLPVGATLYASTGSKWLESTATFVADSEAVAFVVYIGAANQAGGTNLWIDDLILIALDSALSNVIRTSITDIRVRDATDPTVEYTIGVDFGLSNDSTLLQTRPSFRDTQNTSELDVTMLTTVRPLSGGKLKPHQALLLDYDLQPGSMGHHTYDVWRGLTTHLPWPPAGVHGAAADDGAEDWPIPLPMHLAGRPSLGDTHNTLQEGAGAGCFVEPNYYAGHKAGLAGITEYFQQQGGRITHYFLNHDEIHGMAKDSRSLLSGLTNAELVTKSMNGLTAIVKDLDPRAEVLIYDDMINNYQIYSGTQDNLQAEWYGREDHSLENTTHTLSLINDSSIIFIPWFYECSLTTEIVGTLEKYWQSGFRTIGMPYNDNDTVQVWSIAMSQRIYGNAGGGLGLGLVDSDWDKEFTHFLGGGALATADKSWNAWNRTDLSNKTESCWES
jgi:hypothetical protein